MAAPAMAPTDIDRFGVESSGIVEVLLTVVLTEGIAMMSWSAPGMNWVCER